MAEEKGEEKAWLAKDARHFMDLETDPTDQNGDSRCFLCFYHTFMVKSGDFFHLASLDSDDTPHALKGMKKKDKESPDDEPRANPSSRLRA